MNDEKRFIDECRAIIDGRWAVGADYQRDWLGEQAAAKVDPSRFKLTYGERAVTFAGKERPSSDDTTLLTMTYASIAAVEVVCEDLVMISLHGNVDSEIEIEAATAAQAREIWAELSRRIGGPR